MTDTSGSGTAVFPVVVLMRREMTRHRQWSYPKWSLLAVHPDEVPEAGEPARELVHQAEGIVDYRWRGFRVRLTRSNAETYWFNLTSTRPSLFVVCREDPELGLTPVSVTVDQDSASRQAEGDGEVFSAPLPPAMLPWLEDYVMRHYDPEDYRGKRRRKPLDKEGKR